MSVLSKYTFFIEGVVFQKSGPPEARHLRRRQTWGGGTVGPWGPMGPKYKPKNIKYKSKIHKNKRNQLIYEIFQAPPKAKSCIPPKLSFL